MSSCDLGPPSRLSASLPPPLYQNQPASTGWAFTLYSNTGVQTVTFTGYVICA